VSSRFTDPYQLAPYPNIQKNQTTNMVLPNSYNALNMGQLSSFYIYPPPRHQPRTVKNNPPSRAVVSCRRAPRQRKRCRRRNYFRLRKQSCRRQQCHRREHFRHCAHQVGLRRRHSWRNWAPAERCTVSKVLINGMPGRKKKYCENLFQAFSDQMWSLMQTMSRVSSSRNPRCKCL
jgi:hypothetical protein